VCYSYWLWRDGGKWKVLKKGIIICCTVVMCPVVMVGGEGGKWKGLQKRVCMCVRKIAKSDA
jgi:hypothetical protein